MTIRTNRIGATVDANQDESNQATAPAKQLSPEELRAKGREIAFAERQVYLVQKDIAELEARGARKGQDPNAYAARIEAKRQGLAAAQAEYDRVTGRLQAEGVDVNAARAAAPKRTVKAPREDSRTGVNSIYTNPGANRQPTGVRLNSDVVQRSDGSFVVTGRSAGVYSGGVIVQGPGVRARNAGELVRRLPRDLPDMTVRQRVTTSQGTSVVLRSSISGPLQTSESRARYLARTDGANFQSQDEKLYKVNYGTGLYGDTVELRDGVRSRQTTGRPGLYTPAGPDDLRPVSSQQVGLPSPRVTEAKRERPLSKYVPSSGELYGKSKFSGDKSDAPKAAGYFLAGVAVGFGERGKELAVGTGKFVKASIPEKFKTVKKVGKNVVVAATNPGDTLQAIGQEATKNPPKFIGGLTFDYYAGKIVINSPQYARDVYVRAGSKKVPLTSITTPEVASGKAPFPTARSAEESIGAFQSARDPVTGRLRVTSATTAVLKNDAGVPFSGRFTVRRGGRPSPDPGGKLQSQTSGTSGNLARETEGIYVAPADKTSIYFTRLMGKPTEYSLFPKAADVFAAPKVIRMTAQSIERVPPAILAREGLKFGLSNAYIAARKGTGKIFLTARSEKGFKGLPGQTTEIEAVFPTGTQFVKPPARGFFERFKGFREYTVINGRAVPIVDYNPVVGNVALDASRPVLSAGGFAEKFTESSSSLSRVSAPREYLASRAGILSVYAAPMPVTSMKSKAPVKFSRKPSFELKPGPSSSSVRSSFSRPSVSSRLASLSRNPSYSRRKLMVGSYSGSSGRGQSRAVVYREIARGQSRIAVPVPNLGSRGRFVRSSRVVGAGSSRGGSVVNGRAGGASYQQPSRSSGSGAFRLPKLPERKKPVDKKDEVIGESFAERRYTPSLYAIAGNVRGPVSRGAVTSGLSPRAIPELKRKRKGGKRG